MPEPTTESAAAGAEPATTLAAQTPAEGPAPTDAEQLVASIAAGNAPAAAGVLAPATPPAQFYYIMAEVDADGYLMPLGLRYRLMSGEPLPGQPELTLRQRAEMRYAGASLNLPKPEYYLLACGELEQAQLDALSAAAYPGTTRDEDCPPIPAWLGEHPPYQTVFLPDGTILCYGELDLHFVEEAQSSPYISSSTDWPPRLKWYHYTAEGELLGGEVIERDLEGRDWEQLYYNHQPRQHSYFGMSKDGEFTASDYFLGYQIVYNETWKQADLNGQQVSMVDKIDLKSATDWLGQPVDLDQPAPAPPAGCFTPLNRDSLSRTYQAQVQAGETVPGAASPFAGQPGGPQLADPAPRPMPLYAQVYGDGAVRYVLVKPLDDPANPYREQYQPWDYWLRGRIGKEYFNDPGVFEAAQQQHDAAVKEAEASGDKTAIDKARNASINLQPPDNWEHFSLETDANGCLIPYLQSLDRLQLPQGGWGATPRECYEHYLERMLTSTPARRTNVGSLRATGVMPPEVKEQFLAAKWDKLAWQFPVVPAWVVKPVAALNTFDDVMILRDGRSVLVHLEFSIDVNEVDDRGVPVQHITGKATLFGADGSETQSHVIAATEFFKVPQARDLLYPGFRARMDEAEAAGQMLLEIPGSCLVLLDSPFATLDWSVAHTRADFPNLLEAFTLTGQPLGLDDEIPAGLTGVALSGQDVGELYAAQQRVPQP